MPADNYICRKVERAGQAYLRSQAGGFPPTIQDVPVENIVPGTTKLERRLPAIFVECPGAVASEDVPFTGNWLATARVTIRSQADDDDDDGDHHGERAGQVFNLFFTPTVIRDLSDSLGDFTAFSIVPRAQGWGVVDRSWESWMELEIECCGSDVE